MDIRRQIRSKEFIREFPQFYTSLDGKTKIYKAQVNGDPKYYAIKVISLENENELERITRELSILNRIEHKNVIKYVKCVRKHKPNRVICVNKYYTKGDVLQEIYRRNSLTPKAFLSDNELFSHMYALIHLFAYLQSQGISHRDISPRNLYLSSKNEMKLSDFGISEYNNVFIDADEEQEKDLQGTPTYFSPKMRQSYRNFLLTNESTTVKHNTVKSDVYALGINLLHIALLREPREVLSLANQRHSLETTLNSMRYSPTLKSIIQIMLTENEDSRPNFIQLKKFITSDYYPIFRALLSHQLQLKNSVPPNKLKNLEIVSSPPNYPPCSIQEINSK